jgi:hypothetical protein
MHLVYDINNDCAKQCMANFISVRQALSPPRVSTYLQALQDRPPSLDKALELYVWNGQLGAALLTPISVCEVVIRNAVDDALSALHGTSWPWAQGFYLSLSTHARSTLVDARNKQSSTSTGKVIAELSFGFWENMFKASFDAALWTPHLARVLPNLAMPVHLGRGHVHTELAKLRKLRNRIAHHEPLLTLNAQQTMNDLQALIALRCQDTAAWMAQTNDLTPLFAAKPR